MKKLGIYVMMLAMMAVTFVGCKEKENDDPAAPVITMPAKITFDRDNPGDLNFDVAVTSADEDLNSVKVYIMLNEAFEFPVAEITDFGTTPRAWTKTFTAADFPIEQIELAEGSLEFFIKAKTLSNETIKSAPIEIIGGPPPFTELDGPKAFTWERFGSNKGTGLAEFGLEWLSNTGSNIVITPAPGAKLVELTVPDWTALETKEALAAIVEATPGLTKWEVIPTKVTFNYVIATKTADGKYFLLNPTERIVDPNDGGHRTVTGQYKY